VLPLLTLLYHKQQLNSARERFGVSRPSSWKSLPDSLRTADCILTFKRQLKTHFLPVRRTA